VLPATSDASNVIANVLFEFGAVTLTYRDSQKLKASEREASWKSRRFGEI
jgi:hypothetical protein